MSADDTQREKLLARIKAKHAQVNAYVKESEPRGARLSNLGIICSAIAAALTAGPALGGTKFTVGTQQLLGLVDDSVVWRILCFAAMVASLVAAIAVNLYKSNDSASRLAAAQTCAAKLEGLEIALDFGQLPVDEAIKLYQQYITEVPFIEDKPPG